jgi:hypothetical protein
MTRRYFAPNAEPVMINPQIPLEGGQNHIKGNVIVRGYGLQGTYTDYQENIMGIQS